MIIVITPEENQIHEVYKVNQLLKSGIDFLHIRKYNLTDNQLINYINSIDTGYRNKLVLHSHIHLSNLLGIDKIHIRESDRKNGVHQEFVKNKILSTSVHHINDFNNLEPFWNYAFLSPMFQSISKPKYGISHTVLNQIAYRTNKEVKLIGLGGIKRENLKVIKKEKIDGYALLGAIWNQSDPNDYFDFTNLNVFNYDKKT